MPDVQDGIGLRVLVVEDTSLMRRMCENFLGQRGYESICTGSAEEALKLVAEHRPDIALIDLGLPDRDGLDLLAELRQVAPALVTIVITGKGTVENAVRALKLGAIDFIVKPVDFDLLEHSLRGAARNARLASENAELRHRLAADAFAGLVGESPPMGRLRQLIGMVAGSGETVLITGENGTGKDVVARAIHAASPRSARPFVAVNCGAIAETIIESELFGHVKGAFSGAERDRTGCFRQADGGTLFLDEIGEMAPGMQVKLLRALENREVTPVGADAPMAIDLRVVCATNRDLVAAVQGGRFRQDLFYRLAVFPIAVPPLRERAGDIAHLVQHMLGKIAPGRSLHPAALAMLESWPWPGNVRELQNSLRRAALISGAGEIGPEHLPTEMHGRVVDAVPAAVPAAVPVAIPVTAALPVSTAIPAAVPPAIRPLDELEREAVIAALRHFAGDRTRTADALGIDRTTLYRRLKRWQADGLLPTDLEVT